MTVSQNQLSHILAPRGSDQDPQRHLRLLPCPPSRSALHPALGQGGPREREAQESALGGQQREGGGRRIRGQEARHCRPRRLSRRSKRERREDAVRRSDPAPGGRTHGGEHHDLGGGVH